MKINKSFLSFIVYGISSAFLFQGCMQYNVAYTPLVPDSGSQIITRNKYRINEVTIVCKNGERVPQEEFDPTSKLDASSLTSWSKQQVEFGTSMKAIISPINKAAIFRNTSFDTFLGVGYPNEFSAQNKNDRRTAEEIWSTLVKKVDQNWEEWN